MERVVVFVDGSNLFYGIRLLKIRLDYGKLLSFLKGTRQLVRAYFYTSIPDESTLKKNTPEWESYQRQRKFLEEISNLGYKVKTSLLRRRPSGELKEKEIDIMLATDMLSLAYLNAYDTAVLVSGDSDFRYTVEEVQKLGKKVENATFLKTSSPILRRACDKFIPLDEYTERFILKKI